VTVTEKLNQLIDGIEIAMFTSMHSNGQLRSRPMATQAVSEEGHLWFFARQHSSKIDEIRNDHEVNVAYGDPEDMRYVSVSGTCELVRNRSIANDLWKPEYKRWFPQGIEDADLILLKVTINGVEYWDVHAGAMRALEGETTASEHETIHFRDQRTDVA
jgi:general stress protein 26